MSVKQELQRHLHTLMESNKDGSYGTREARRKILFKVAEDLCSHGYKLRHMNGLKQKHIRFLNELWLKQGISIATIKNRNSHLRWLCRKINRDNVIPSTNEALGIGKRKYSHNQPTAVELKDIDLSKITNPYLLVSVHLQRYLGLRREEALMFKPHLADRGDHVDLRPSWCKGNRGRVVPIIMPEARYWIDESKKLVKADQSLIPPNKMRSQQKYLYDNQLKRAGAKHPHGLRHAYAQERYFQLTGWHCPKQGGPLSDQLTPAQKQKDREARLTISEELGHSREQITVVYLGR